MRNQGGNDHLTQGYKMVNIDKKNEIMELVQSVLSEHFESLRYPYNTTEEDDKLLWKIIATKKILSKIEVYG